MEDVVERATNIKKKIGLTSIESTRLALTIPFISDVDISENGIRVAKLLHSYGVDVAQVTCQLCAIWDLCVIWVVVVWIFGHSLYILLLCGR